MGRGDRRDGERKGKTSCLKAVMPRTVAWEAAQIARMTRPPTKAGLALVALGLFGQVPPLGESSVYVRMTPAS